MTRGTYDYATGEAFDSHGVSLGCFANRHEAIEAMVASFWSRQPVVPIPLLQQLNDWVIQQDETRMPKWKIRFAADLAIQIQSKITRKHALWFEGRALQTENMTAKFFLERKELYGSRYWQINFKLFAEDNSAMWVLKLTRAARGHACPSSGYTELRQRIVKVLHPDRFIGLTPGLMLSSNCLCCGKSLTDPASMARWIGPECWGSASTNLPRIFNTMEA
jgi:hypothetical protein